MVRMVSLGSLNAFILSIESTHTILQNLSQFFVMDSQLTQHELEAICGAGCPFSHDEMSRLVFDLLSTPGGDAYYLAEQRFFLLMEPCIHR